jgi:AsmA protein
MTAAEFGIAGEETAMNTVMNRRLKIAGIVVAVLVVIVLIIPLFIDANSFRPTLESDLSTALGRPVKVGNLSLSLFSGSVTADNISIADDPAFSTNAFVQAKSLKVGVELIPLIFSKALHVTELTLNDPQISLVRSQDGEKWNFSSLGNSGASGNATGGGTGSGAGNSSAANNAPTKPASTPAGGAASGSATNGNSTGGSSANGSAAGGTSNLSIGKLKVSDGKVTVSRAGSSEQPRVYDKVDIEGSNFSFTNSFPFKMSANLPAGGTLKLDGSAGPIDANNAARTPLQAKVSVKQMNLAASGFIDPAAGISGIADFEGTVASDGHEAKTSGALNAQKLQVVKQGAPAGKPVQLQYAVTYDLAKSTGALTQGEVTIGKAVAHLAGTYDAHGTTTTVNLKLNGQGLPVDDLEAALPAVGVILPSGSQLKGGTMMANLTIVGPVDKLVTAGNVKLENSALAGFNLGSKLSSISALSGKAGGAQKDTTIQSFSADVKMSPAGTDARNINLLVPSLGNATGAGTVSPNNALDFKMKADNIPFTIQGTTSDPKFLPDVKGMATGLMQNAMGGAKGQKNPIGGLGGMLKKP